MRTRFFPSVNYVLLGALVFLQALSVFNKVSAHAQASLLSDDRDDIVVTYKDDNGNDVTSTFSVLRDAFNRSLWYYVPKSPRLTYVTINNVKHPELTLLRYQFVDATAPGGSRDGGILQFAVSLAAEDNALVALKEKLKAKPEAPANLQLAPLPIKSAEAFLYTPTDGQLVSKTYGTGLFPTFATQKAPFVLYLSRAGADINDALIGNSTTSNTGVPLAVVFTYQALTPPATLKVAADYKKIFEHYSADKVFAAKASYFGLFGASSRIQWSEIRENLRIGGALTVEKVGNEEISDDNMNAVMQGVMKRINDNVFQALSPPPTIAPASAQSPTLPDRFISAGYNASFKTFTQGVEYKDTFMWTERKIVERKTLAGGFIGIAQYPPNIRMAAVQFVPGFNWDLAHALLPDIGLLPGLQKVTITTKLMNGAVTAASKTAVWKPMTGWLSVPENTSIASLDFSIASLLQNGVPSASLKFSIKTTVQQSDRNTEITNVQDAVQEGFPVAPLGEGISAVSFDPSSLHFKNIEANANLLKVQVSMQVGTRSFSASIQPRLENGTFVAPNPLVWAISAGEAVSQPIKVTLKFEYVTGVPLSREVRIDDLRVEDPALNHTLRDPAITANP